MGVPVFLIQGPSYTPPARPVPSDPFVKITDSYPVGGVTTPGADPSGSADSAPAINYWLGHANQVLAPPGNYKLKSPVLFSQNGTTLFSMARGYSTRFIADDAGGLAGGDAVTIKNLAGCTIQNIGFTSMAARTAGNYIRVTGGDPTQPLSAAYRLMDCNAEILDVDMDGAFYGTTIDNDVPNDYRNWRTTIRGGRCRNLSTNGVGIWINAGSGTNFGGSQVIENWWMGQNPNNALAAIRISQTGGAIIQGDMNSFGAQHCVLIDPPAGAFLTSLTFTGGFYDGSSLSNIRIVPDPAVAVFGAIRFVGCWIAGSTAAGNVEIIGAAAKDIRFSGCTIYSAAAGWNAVVDAARQVSFRDCSIAGATSGGLKFTNGAHSFDVQCNDFWAGIGTGQQGSPIGVQIDAGSDNYQVVNNNMEESVVKIVNTPGAAATRIVSPNRT